MTKTMATKKDNYINADLAFAEEQLAQWRIYLENNPINEIKDRWGKKEMPKGGQTWVVTASAEQQIKCVQDTMVRYLELLRKVDELREKEQAKVETRGKAEMSAQAEEWLKGRRG